MFKEYLHDLSICKNGCEYLDKKGDTSCAMTYGYLWSKKSGLFRIDMMRIKEEKEREVEKERFHCYK